MGNRTIGIVLCLSALFIGACSSKKPKKIVVSQPPATVVVPYKPAPIKPKQAVVVNDQCQAKELQYLVGRPRTEIPIPLYPHKRRVVCLSCVLTADVNLERQTIIFDEKTGLIRSVKCF